MHEIFAARESAVRSYCRSFPVVFERASGHHLWDTSGRRYVDLLCGAGALNYGHNHPEMVRRVVDYLTAGGPVQSLDLHTRAKAEFLEKFAQLLDAKGMSDYVVQFPGPAGTLAVEAALKLARKVTGRTHVVAFRGGFHGASLGSLAATTSPLLRGGAGTPLPHVTILPYDSTPELESAVLSGPVPAAFILETVQGEGGLNAATRPWLGRVRRLADRLGAHVIVDDVQAGCGRTGRFFSFEEFPELRPDLVCLSKSLSGMGLPMAALLIRRELDRWAPGEHNGTFRGHNLAFVAGSAALDLWADPDFAGRVADLAGVIRQTLTEIVAQLPGHGLTLVGRGAMSGLRFPDADLAGAVRDGLFRAGVIAETSGNGSVLKLFPPLTLTPAQWCEIADLIRDVIADAADTARGSAVVSAVG
ncbi:diaminobutyrate--2-oxoglutarate aminotransferase [Lentzea aerocolonigenes]|uniref:Diaminobutyrate--2-oxoglutarate transaminase n=1 Tax=Lentzea aerocolonigenes TaxID=68170 RepID=A0A0F0GYY7_LENAE|nr:diaminobutyrate--2-oxoglutarate transaminase [Lentzea aerocolonigenes]KJK47222.1 diaminobutyrate--2-oxoglutarate aminotransferase [Lentzea aerocolonigenes]